MMLASASAVSSGSENSSAELDTTVSHRKMPNVPILRSTPASSSEPVVGASTCASGSHPWNGYSGILTIRGSDSAPYNSSVAEGLSVQVIPDIVHHERSPRDASRSTSAASMKSEATKVYTKNWYAAQIRRDRDPRVPITRNSGTSAVSKAT